jgi:hypothetical protein
VGETEPAVISGERCPDCPKLGQLAVGMVCSGLKEYKILGEVITKCGEERVELGRGISPLASTIIERTMKEIN